MKCINCRCVIPDTSPYCIYCGHAAYRDDSTTYQVSEPTYQVIASEPPAVSQAYPAYQGAEVYHRYADYDDPNRFYGIPEENDGSDAYDYYYDEIKYDEQQSYLDSGRNRSGGIMLFSSDNFIGGTSVARWLCCLAGLDLVIILLLLIIMLMMML